MSQQHKSKLKLSSFTLADIKQLHAELGRLLREAQSQADSRSQEHYEHMYRLFNDYKEHAINLYRRYFTEWEQSEDARQSADGPQTIMDEREPDDNDEMLDVTIATLVDTKRQHRHRDAQTKADKTRKQQIWIHPLSRIEENEAKRDNKQTCAYCRKRNNRARLQCLQCRGCPPLHDGICNIKYHNPHCTEEQLQYFDRSRAQQTNNTNTDSFDLKLEGQWKTQPASEKPK
jgi:hypothetical protein